MTTTESQNMAVVKKQVTPKRIYLDNAATTPIDRPVLEVMTQAMQDQFGNPSSIHAEGRKARAAIEAARKTVADALNASIGEIFFTSGGTEANNMALKCAVRDLGVTRIISSPIEHHCILHSLDTLKEQHSVEIVMVNVQDDGQVDLNDLRKLLANGHSSTMLSLMHSNNEIGSLLDLKVVSEMCLEYNAYFHSDTVQTLGYYPFDLEQIRINFMSGAAHKFHGPQGVGFIYINGDNQIKPYLDGGAQERNMRAGTENLYGILGLAKALELAYAEREEREQKVRGVRDYFKSQLESQFTDIRFNGNPEKGHYKVLSVCFPPSPKSGLLLLSLDIAGISVSGGSACSSGADTGSHVINHLQGESDRTTIRFSFSHHNTKEEVDVVVAKLKEILA